jgi:hypothetical protein
VFGGLLGALTGAFRSSDIVGVLIWLLHRELKNKTCRVSSQEFLEKITYTKVTSGGAPARRLLHATATTLSLDGRGTDAQ